MGISEKDWQEEQQRVRSITTKIGRRIEQLEKEVGRVRADVVHIRKHFWDEVTVNVGSSDDIVETHFAIKQQAEVLSERERRYRHSAMTLKTLTRLVQSPYFGRIDFTEKGIEQAEQIYIGIGSFRDEDSDSFLVYDWRAPISSLYYDYAPGPVEYQAPYETVTGSMTLKRQFVIRDGQIRLMFDSGVTIGDELLMEVLSRHSDAQMKSIVATIQKEQNRIIRNDTSRMLIVQGAAGSGKTSAGLQRVAYLLYKYRETLQADQMVLFSPNPLFNSYVSTVLPELGEQNMQQTTFQEYLEFRLNHDFSVEDPFSQMEYILSAADSVDYRARISGIHYKSSTGFLHSINTYKEHLEQEGMIFLPVRFEGHVIASSERIKEQFYSFDRSIRLAHRIEMVCEWLLKELSAFVDTQLEEEWVEEAINLLEPEEYQRVYNKLRKMQKGKGVTFDDYDKEKELLSRMVVERRLKPLRSWIKRLQFVDILELYRHLFADEQLYVRISDGMGKPEYWQEICRLTIGNLEQRLLAYEDATPFLYLKELVLGLHVNTSVRHVIVDEAQDYSPVQFEFLKRLFPRSKMTVLGDLNQKIYVNHSALADFNTLAAVYGPNQTEIIRLTQSYRSTRQIVEFTRGMVAGGEEIQPFQRNGEKPHIIVSANDDERINQIIADIESLRKMGYESIAVICKTALESADVFSSLKERVQLRLITKYTPTFEKETLVIPAYLAKGVEFDAVIIYDGSAQQYSREIEQNLFYTACTRAMHLLHIYTVGEPSPFILSQRPDTYMFKAANPQISPTII